MFFLYTENISHLLDIPEIRCSLSYNWVDSIDVAEYAVFPIFYEVMFEYSDEEYALYKLSKADIELAKKAFQDAQELVSALQKKLIVFYYRDPSYDLMLGEHVILFRTSLYKNKRSINELGLPAFIPDISESFQQFLGITYDESFILEKKENPSVAFAGQSAPLNLGWKANVRLHLHHYLEKLSLPAPKIYYNRGYLARRSAILSVQKEKAIQATIKLTSWSDGKTNPITYKKNYLQLMYEYPYQLCASGFGNYSFRFYEIMAAGRIPVFINTDCMLPFEHSIDWKKHVVWIEEREVRNTGKRLLEFHSSIHPDDFKQLQIKNRELFQQYLTKKGFLSHLSEAVQVFK